jgi:hypothetical protein
MKQSIIVILYSHQDRDRALSCEGKFYNHHYNHLLSTHIFRVCAIYGSVARVLSVANSLPNTCLSSTPSFFASTPKAVDITDDWLSGAIAAPFLRPSVTSTDNESILEN